MTTPLGRPAWERAASITDYGGHVSKADYMTQGVVKPQTDVGAAAIMRAADHLASVSRTSEFCTLSITCQDTLALDPIVSLVSQMTGVTLTSYVGNAPPTGFPTVTRQSDGIVNCVWAATYADAYGVSSTTSIRHHGASSNTDLVSANSVTVNARTVRIYLRTASTGAVALDASATLSVW